MSKWETNRNDLRWMLQKMEKNIVWYGECSCLQHWNQQCSWERITWTIVIPSRIQQTSHWKQMFDKSARSVSEQDETSGVDTIGWKVIHENTCHWLVMKELPIFNARKSTSFRILCCALVSFSKILNRTMHGNKDWNGSNHLHFTEPRTEPTASQWNSSGVFSSLLYILGETPEIFTGRMLFMSMFNDISCGTKDNEEECLANAGLVSLYARCVWFVMTLLAKILHCNNMENEMKSFHNKTDWENFVWMQDFWLLLKSDSISWRKTLQKCHNSQMQLLVVSTLFQEMKKHRNQKDGSREHPKLGPYW